MRGVLFLNGGEGGVGGRWVHVEKNVKMCS